MRILKCSMKKCWIETSKWQYMFLWCIRAVKFFLFQVFVELKIKSTFECKMLHSNFRCLSGSLAHEMQWRGVFFSLSSWTYSMRCCTFKILRKTRTSMWRRCCLPQNWNQAVHTERIFIAFSRETSIIVALASHTREPKDKSNSCKFNFKKHVITRLRN